MQLKLLIVIVLFLLLPVQALADETSVGGRILMESGPLKGARVYAYKSYAEIQSGTPLLVSEPADEKGLYNCRLPQGEYYFVARGIKEGREVFAYHGNNPIKVGSKDTWITLLVNEAKSAAYVAGTGSLKGVVTFKGQPVKGAYVTLYKYDTRRFKGLGFRTESTGADGGFDFPVASGKYVVVAKKIGSGKGNRPLKKGDLFCYFPSNPVEVLADNATQIEVPCYPKDDRASFIDTPPIKADSFKTIVHQSAGLKAGIRGRVTDSSGKPVSGILVLAYQTTKPVFLTYHLSHGTEYSTETDADGNYFIPVDASGDYYLVARDNLGDGPHRGELYGLYNGNSRHVVAYDKGKLSDNINITAGKIMDEPKKDMESALLSNFAKNSAEPSSDDNGTTVIGDNVIDKDTTWKGEVLVKGVVVLKKGVTLVIEPGTIIKFVRIDRDNNGVGDGELRIEGRIIARGTKEKRIVFTSAEKKKATKDWSYIHLLASHEENIFQYCRFEYGFSGMQVHYSSATISDSLFTANYEGLHFNTADIVVEHNAFVDNDTAIRFKRLEGKVVISNNNILGNALGVLFGRQQINAVDFENLNKPIEYPLFKNNNFQGNDKYNFSMGEGQNLDINVTNNWWGTSERPKINGSIFDNTSDSTLGRVVYVPFLTAPQSNAGIRENDTVASSGNK